MKKVKITQVKSAIDRPQRQKDTIKALGLTKMHKAVEHVSTPQVLGMIEKVRHLITIEEV